MVRFYGKCELDNYSSRRVFASFAGAQPNMVGESVSFANNALTGRISHLNSIKILVKMV